MQVGELYISSGTCSDELSFYDEDEDTKERRLLRSFREGDNPNVLLIASSSRGHLSLQSCRRYSLSENQGFSAYVTFEGIY